MSPRSTTPPVARPPGADADPPSHPANPEAVTDEALAAARAENEGYRLGRPGDEPLERREG